jgi:hypothetical protein
MSRKKKEVPPVFRVKPRAIAAATLLAVVTGIGLPAPGPAATGSYTITAGAGTHAHLWVTSKAPPDGTCTIDTDYTATKQPFVGIVINNLGDSAVFKVSELPVANSRLQVTWHTNVTALATFKLLLRFVKAGCATGVEYLNVPVGTSTWPVPAGSVYLVVSATEGAGQPSFAFG